MLNNFSLWLSFQEIRSLFEQTLHALNAKKLKESINVETIHHSDPLTQLKPMNAAFSKLFGLDADWVNVAVFALNGVNRFNTASSDFVDSLTETLSDIYMCFSDGSNPTAAAGAKQDGCRRLHDGLLNLQSQQIEPEDKRNQMLKLFRMAVVNRFRNRSSATVRLKRQVPRSRTRADRHPTFTPYDDLIKGRSNSKPHGEDDAAPDDAAISGRFGKRDLMDTDEGPEEIRGMGDDGTTLIQATKQELLAMMAQGKRSESRDRIQLAHDSLEEIIRMKQSGAAFSEYIQRFGTHGKKVSAIFKDIQKAFANAGQKLGLTIADKLVAMMDREEDAS